MHFPLGLEVSISQPLSNVDAMFLKEVEIRGELEADDPPIFTIEETDGIAAGLDRRRIDEPDPIEAEAEPSHHLAKPVRDAVDYDRPRPIPQLSVTLLKLLAEVCHA